MKVEFGCCQEGEGSRWLCDKAETGVMDAFVDRGLPNEEVQVDAPWDPGLGPGSLLRRLEVFQPFFRLPTANPSKTHPKCLAGPSTSNSPNPTSFIWRH